MEFTSPHKYIKNTSTNETILTEHLLNTSGEPQTPKRTRKIPTQLGRMKERKKRGNGTRPAPLAGGAIGEERFPHSGKPPHRWRGDQLGQRGGFGDSEESAASGLWQAGQSKTHMDGPYCTDGQKAHEKMLNITNY